VPVYLRTGKKTSEKHTFVVIEFKKFDFQNPQEEPNRLIIEIQPNARVTIRLLNRLGESGKYQELMTSDSIACDIEGCLDDHASLILDAIKNEKNNFLSFPEIIRTWQITDEIISLIKNKKIKVESYTDGTDGPTSQHRLTDHDEFAWFDVHV
jgi:glucose-6-phosphate 1-dehydrogenase